MTQFKRLLESSETFRKIFKEETSRIKKILKEYNENEIWKNLTSDVRKAALMSVDDDMGSDFADEYSDTDWMQLPDVITNRLDLKRFDIPNNINPMALADFIQQHANELPTEAWYQSSVGPKLKTNQIIKLLQSGFTSTKNLTKDIIGNLLAQTDIDINYDELVDSNYSLFDEWWGKKIYQTSNHENNRNRSEPRVFGSVYNIQGI
jgi:hypothetical protein